MIAKHEDDTNELAEASLAYMRRIMGDSGAATYKDNASVIERMAYDGALRSAGFIAGAVWALGCKHVYTSRDGSPFFCLAIADVHGSGLGEIGEHDFVPTKIERRHSHEASS